MVKKKKMWQVKLLPALGEMYMFSHDLENCYIYNWEKFKRLQMIRIVVIDAQGPDPIFKKNALC